MWNREESENSATQW